MHLKEDCLKETTRNEGKTRTTKFELWMFEVWTWK
jgi:hypothetical protein